MRGLSSIAVLAVGLMLLAQERAPIGGAYNGGGVVELPRASCQCQPVCICESCACEPKLPKQPEPEPKQPEPKQPEPEQPKQQWWIVQAPSGERARVPRLPTLGERVRFPSGAEWRVTAIAADKWQWEPELKQQAPGSQLQVLVFGQPGCPPCRRYKRVWQSKAGVVYVDTAMDRETAQRYGVTSTPTTVVLQGGREVARRVGALSDAQYAALTSLGTAPQATVPRAVRPLGQRPIIPEPPQRAYVRPATLAAYVRHNVQDHGFARSRIGLLGMDDQQKLHGWAHSGAALPAAVRWYMRE